MIFSFFIPVTGIDIVYLKTIKTNLLHKTK